MLSCKCTAVIAAAGKSSRMKAFKPLLQLGNDKLIRRGIITLRKAGVTNIVIITGRDAELIIDNTSDLDVITVHNPDFASTQMLDSIKLGLAAALREYSETERFLFLPGDVPLFLESTVKAVADDMAEVTIPVCGGKKGHPVAFGAQTAEYILNYNGDFGLSGAFASLNNTHFIDVDDAGMLMDADTPEDYEKLQMYDRNNKL